MTELVATGIVAAMTILSGSMSTGALPTMCTMQYEPVCAEKQVQCVTTPCNPIRSTYGNACMAAADQATIIFEGDCNIAEGGVIVGGDKDEHGCIGSAGYIWSEDAQQCIRPREEEQNVVTWAHSLGLTKFATVADFNWDALVTREQAAKMIMATIDASGLPEWMIKQADGSCVWTDADTIDSSLLPMVTRSCSKGLFHGSNGKFMPKAYLTDTDAMTVMTRAAQYIPALADIMMRSKFAVTDKPLTRGELLTRLQNLMTSLQSANPIGDPVPAMTMTGEYYLISHNGTGITNTGITMMFDDTGVHAKFCNTMNATYLANNGAINFGPMMSTMMYCDDTQLMSLESEFGSLSSVSYTTTATSLTMTTSGSTWIWGAKYNQSTK